MKKSDNIYIIEAYRNKSQFNQTIQTLRCKILEAYSDYILVESLKRYNKKYAGAVTSKSDKYVGKPIRRINKNQVIRILDEKTVQSLKWETIRRREGTSKSPGRSKVGR
jgi:hypothetical protein